MGPRAEEARWRGWRMGGGGGGDERKMMSHPKISNFGLCIENTN